MRNNRIRLALVATLALSVSAGLIAADVASAKKKAKAGGTVDITQQVNQAIPDGTNDTNGVLASPITVGGKKFKGTKVRDVNVTFQTTGANPNAAVDLAARVSAPNGATTWLIGNDLSGQSIGPLTLDDESPNGLGGNPPAPDSTTLVSPYAGTAQPDCFFTNGLCTFWPMDNGPVTGTWTLRIYDTAQGLTSTLNAWRLTVVAGKAFQTK